MTDRGNARPAKLGEIALSQTSGEPTVDAVLSRELEGVACAHAEELAAAVPGFEAALASA